MFVRGEPADELRLAAAQKAVECHHRGAVSIGKME